MGVKPDELLVRAVHRLLDEGDPPAQWRCPRSALRGDLMNAARELQKVEMKKGSGKRGSLLKNRTWMGTRDTVRAEKDFEQEFVYLVAHAEHNGLEIQVSTDTPPVVTIKQIKSLDDLPTSPTSERQRWRSP